MRSPVYALAWEFYCANRRGWLCVLATVFLCAIAYPILATPLQKSDGRRSLSFLPFVISLIFAAGFCNFTDRSRRNGIAGFPQHLFTLPLRTPFLVMCLMACALVSLSAIYVAWAKLVFEPVGIELMIRWPLTLLAAGVVLYQAIIWCLSGFRLARVLLLSVLLSALVGVGFMPVLSTETGGPAMEGRLTAALLAVVVIAYCITIAIVEAQRRGGARGWALADAVADAAAWATPGLRNPIQSANAALFWLEWRRSGLVLPAAVLLSAILILGPILWLTGRGPDETIRAAFFLLITPVFMTLAVGKGMSKPDFWSLELSLPLFLTGRPISCAQMVGAKMITAAASALLAWALLLTIAPLWMYLTCDVQHLGDLWRQFQLVYSPFAEWAIPVLVAVAVILVTWSQLVGGIWIGSYGRLAIFYATTALSAGGLIALLVLTLWWADHPHSRGEFAVVWAPRIAWILAAGFAAKMSFAVWAASHALQKQLISRQAMVRYLTFWLFATALVVWLAWLISPRVLWLRNTLILAALLTVPLARIAVSPRTMAQNRHR